MNSLAEADYVIVPKADRHFVSPCCPCACTGCGGPRQRVEGNILFDGEPVDGGVIIFMKGSGPGSDRGNAPIMGGNYVIEGDRAKNLDPGSYLVQIFWIQKLNKPGATPGNNDSSPAVKNLIPAKFNAKSTLTREIVEGSNKYDFDLKSK